MRTSTLISVRRFIVLVLSINLFCILAYPTQAQQVSLSLSPPHLEAIMKPGKSILIAYTVENLSDPVTLTTRVLPMQPRGQKGEVSHSNSLEGPIEFKLDNAQFALQDSFFLKSRAKQQILLRIKVPETTPEGDYYYTLFVKTQPTGTGEGSVEPRATASIGSHILITVTDTGNIDVKGKISFFDTLGGFSIPWGANKIHFFDSFKPVPIRLTVENSGANLTRASGAIELRGNFSEVARYQLIEQNVLSHSSRNVQATPSAAFDCSNSNAKTEACKNGVSLVLSGFFIGKYTLSSNVIFSGGLASTSAQTIFWALPFRLLLAVILLLGISMLFIKKYRSDPSLSTSLEEESR